MTPQERQMIDELFDRLARLENKPRDPEAERAISDGLAVAPHALYPLVQTVLVQDEALRQADARIRELQGEAPQEQGGFLESMRDNLFGRRDEGRGSVPSIRPGAGGFRNEPGYRAQPEPAQPPYQQQQGAFGGGGSFLGTAAASAAGVIGGAMLLNSFRSMMGGGEQRHGALDQSASQNDKSPWGGDAANSDLSRQAGADDIGRGGPLASNDQDRQGMFDTAYNDADDDSDLGGFDIGGDGDVA